MQLLTKNTSGSEIKLGMPSLLAKVSNKVHLLGGSLGAEQKMKSKQKRQTPNTGSAFHLFHQFTLQTMNPIDSEFLSIRQLERFSWSH